MYITVKQAAALLQVSTKTISRRIASGEIQIVRLSPKSIRIDESAFQAYISKLTTV